MNATAKSPQPIRAGIFKTVPEADRAVAELVAAGFTDDKITVICSAEAVQQHFKKFEHQDPAGQHTPAAAMTGGAIGATLGGLVAVAGIVTVGGAALFVAGGLVLFTGGIVGSLVGAMMTRGRILVAVEQTGPAHQGLLDQAVKIFAKHGVDPLPLAEG